MRKSFSKQFKRLRIRLHAKQRVRIAITRVHRAYISKTVHFQLQQSQQNKQCVLLFRTNILTSELIRSNTSLLTPRFSGMSLMFDELIIVYAQCHTHLAQRK